MPRFDKLRRALTANLGLKIVSLVFALVIWFYVTAQEAEKQGFKVPLVLANIPDSLTVLQEVPTAVDVAVTGTKSDLLKLRFFSKMKAVVDCSSAKGGTMMIPLTAGNVRIPGEVRPGEVTIESPRALLVTFEAVERRYVPVHATFSGELGKDLVFAGPPTIVPDRVFVSGAASAMTGVSSVSTAPIPAPTHPASISREVPIDLGGRRLNADPSKVLVEARVSARAVRTIENITPTVLQADESLSVEYAPKTAAITIEGPEDLVKNLSSDEVSIVLDVTMRKPGAYKLRPDVIVPQGIEKYSLDVAEFDVTLSSKARGGR
jgi:YbbR domain-containing protein